MGSFPGAARQCDAPLHIFAATVWVGGQVVLAAIVPLARRLGGRDATRAIARRFQIVAWPAFAVLLVTGTWNLFAGAAIIIAGVALAEGRLQAKRSAERRATMLRRT